MPYHSPRLLRRLWRCARCHRPGEAAQGLGSLTKDRVDRREKPHVGGPGGPLVSRTSASTMTSPPFFPKGAPRLVILSERAERARREGSDCGLRKQQILRAFGAQDDRLARSAKAKKGREGSQGPSVTAPRLALDTSFAYFASTPDVYFGAGGCQRPRRRARTSSGTSSCSSRRSASIVIASPSSTSASVPPVAASGATWPTTRP